MTDVEICNLALAHIGDRAIVSAITPPDGTPQARLCSIFYPVTRDALLEHAWAFNTKRAALTLKTFTVSTWDYAYALPADCLKVQAILDSGAPDDYGVHSTVASSFYPASATATPQPFVVEVGQDGTRVIYTNQPDAWIRYSARITDTTLFSASFSDALAWQLAVSLAGPIIRGAEGVKVAKECARMAAMMMSKAGESDSQNRHHLVQHSAPWMVNR